MRGRGYVHGDNGTAFVHYFTDPAKKFTFKFSPIYCDHNFVIR